MVFFFNLWEGFKDGGKRRCYCWGTSNTHPNRNRRRLPVLAEEKRSFPSDMRLHTSSHSVWAEQIADSFVNLLLGLVVGVVSATMSF